MAHSKEKLFFKFNINGLLCWEFLFFNISFSDFGKKQWSKDMGLRMLFALVSKYWVPKPRKKSKKEVEPLENGECQGIATPEPEEAQDSSESTTPEVDGEVDGMSTPKKSITIDDEYLAFTLGGDLRDGSPLANIVNTDVEMPPATEHKDQVMSEDDLEKKLAVLE